MNLTNQKLSKEQFELIKQMLLFFLSTGDNPEDGMSQDDVLAALANIDEAENQPIAPILGGITAFLKPIVAQTPTLWDDMIVNLLDASNEGGAFLLIKALVARIRRRRELRRTAKDAK